MQNLLKNSRNGMTLVEILLVMLILGGFILFAIGGISSCGIGGDGGSVQMNAQQQAMQYANFMYPNMNARAQCVEWDSDGDGYVSCTVVYDTKDGVGKDAIECAAGWNLNGAINSGCRTPKMRATTQIQ